MANKTLCSFDNSYVTLPSRFYEKVMPAKLSQPQLLQWNTELADKLELKSDAYSENELAQIFSGQIILESSVPIAMAYAGHQFGHFVPQLGDGRAILLGEILNSKAQRFDIQLKGSGVTPFSRNGDGQSAIGPVIREYIVSEAMFHLGVPTTRSLAAVSTGETVYREQALPGAILTRVAKSHIRIGHFEYFAARGDVEGIKILAEHCIHRHYPEIENSVNKFSEFLQKVIDAQATLIAHWMEIGFIHGVMNTDNMLISGESIDFGPCAFMDNFSFDKVFSSIDRNGRYAYQNQPEIAQWNLERLAACLKPLLEANSTFSFHVFEKEWAQRMRNKLGLLTNEPQDYELIKKWLSYLQDENLDYTLSFRNLAKRLDEKPTGEPFASTQKFKDFESLWRKRLEAQPFDHSAAQKKMNQVNPIFIARNHQVERAILGAQNGDWSVFKDMIQVLKRPFQEQPAFEVYKKVPLPAEQVTATFCGT